MNCTTRDSYFFTFYRFRHSDDILPKGKRIRLHAGLVEDDVDAMLTNDRA